MSSRRRLVRALLASAVSALAALSACDWCRAAAVTTPAAGTHPGEVAGGTFRGEPPDPARTRRYFVAAEPVDWIYAPTRRDVLHEAPLPAAYAMCTTYAKARYVAYTDDTFTTPAPSPPWQGLLGPMLHVVVGEFLVVTFINRTDRALSMHPHGVTYDKDSEGAFYFPDPGKGAWVSPGGRFTYVWKAEALPHGASSQAWLYHSHVRPELDIQAGLAGVLVVTDPAHARADGSPDDVDTEVPALFQVFNETPDLGPLADPDDEDPARREQREAFARLPPADQALAREGGIHHAINGFTFANLPRIELAYGARVRWYVAGLGSEEGLHSVHWHGHVPSIAGRSADVAELLPASVVTADMVADNPGCWLIECHVADHMMEGMTALYEVARRASRR